MYISIGASTIKGKKLMEVFYDTAKKKVKTTHFGNENDNYEDYMIHRDSQYKKNYIRRYNELDKWEDYMCSDSLVFYILWNQPNLKESIMFYMNKFNLNNRWIVYAKVVRKRRYLFLRK